MNRTLTAIAFAAGAASGATTTAALAEKTFRETVEVTDVTSQEAADITAKFFGALGPQAQNYWPHPKSSVIGYCVRGDRGDTPQVRVWGDLEATEGERLKSEARQGLLR